MILGINTAENVHQMVLLDDEKIIAQKDWQDARSDVDNLVPFLEKMLGDLELNKHDIKQIVAVRGPGSFTALRTGIAFANALSQGLKAELYTMDTFELLQKKASIKDPLIVLLPAGGLDVGMCFNQEIQVGEMATLLAKIPHDQSTHVAYILPETLHDELLGIAKEKEWQIIPAEKLQTFAEALLTCGLSGMQKVEVIEPLYLKTPNITLSTDPWKKP